MQVNVPATALVSTVSTRSLLAEAATAIAARPSRSVLTALGTVLGVGTLVVVVGLASTAAGQVSAHFDAQAATTVVVTDSREPLVEPAPFPFDEKVIERVQQLNGVVGAGLIYAIGTDAQVESPNPAFAEALRIPLYAVSPSAWPTIDPTMSAGRTFDDYSDHLPVVVLGKAAAARLGISSYSAPTSVLIGGRPFVVAGVLDDVSRRPDLLLSAIVPAGTSGDIWGPPTPKEAAELVIATRPGAALQVAEEARVAVSTAPKGDVRVSSPPDPRTLRESVSSDLSGLLIALSGICLLVGCVGIASTTLVAVMERSAEFGLRRAVGARGRDIFAQVLAESAGLGVLGGFLGAGLGVVLTISVAVVRGWSPIVEPWALLWAPLLGLVTGVVAGFYPARRATRIEPTEALRGH